MVILNETDNKQGLKSFILEASYFTACAGAITLFEAIIPKPMPFMKIGLANVVLMLLIMNSRYLTAFIVLFGKVLIGGVFVGTLLMPTTAIGLASSLVALTVMIVLKKKRLGLSWVGISISSAVVHNIFQLIVVRNILIYSNSVYRLIPLMIILGVVSGSITGLIVSYVNYNFKDLLNEKIFV